MKTIYITEEQKKKLKKAITPQEQVGKKVNAGVMDAVVGGMCEDAEDDKFVLGAEMNAPIGGVYYHVKESKLNESPDYIDFFDDRFNNSDAYPFIYLWNKQQLYIGQGGQTHIDVVNEIDQELNNDFSNPRIPYSAHCDEMLTGRYWQEHNVISFWKTPIDKRMNVRKVIDALKEQGIIQSSEYTVLDYWDNNTMSCCIFPIKWLFNGTYNMFAGRCSRIAPIKPLEYSRTGKYTYFQVNTNGSGIQCVNVSGNEILTGMEYYMKTSSMSEGRKKVVKNDKGEIVPEKCDKCGGDVVVQIHGEPVYICKDCGKYFGTMPFSLKEGKLNESFEDIYDIYEDYQIYDLLSEFEEDKRNGITVKQWNLIPAQQYHTLLKRYMASPEMARIPYNVVYNWFMTVVKNAVSIEYITQLAGHTQFFPVDDVMDYFGEELNGYEDGSEYLESIGFYDWCKLPDGTDAWSDYGLKPLFEIINEYKPNASAEEILILINRCLDVVHWRGDLSSAFIQGGKKSCDYISNLKESIDYKKWLRQLKKRRDPDNIEENIEIEDKWNGEGEKLEPLKRLSRVPEFLYHCSYTKNRESILKNGIYASVGDEYKDWWNYKGPNGEIPDDDELEYLVFLSSRPYAWADNYPIDEMDIYKIDTKQLDRHCFYFDPDKFMALKGSVCYTLNIPPSAIELFDTVYRHKSIKENIENEIAPEDVDLSSFNIKKRLNPKFWSDGHLDSRIRLKLMDISNDFIEYLGIEPNIVEDVLMTGSLANFNWSEEFSDIDLHILLDYSDVDENTEFVKQYFMSQKNSWNNEHGDITIFGFPVEVYVQDINEKHDSSGVYSLDRDKWLIEPDRNILATSKVNKKLIKDKVSDYTNKIDKLVYLYGKAKDDEYKLGKIAEKANVLWDEIKNSRKKGFEISNGKEINNFNIIFKTLRRFGYLDKLYQLKTKTYNKLNSID